MQKFLSGNVRRCGWWSLVSLFRSSRSEPLSGASQRKKPWVCGQRNAAHIFAIAAVEVMRSRVGACRAEHTSLLCINNRMSYCCTNWAVFYWARVCLREDRRWTPPPLPLIYTITSPDVCFAEVFPIPEWTSPPSQPPHNSKRQEHEKKVNPSLKNAQGLHFCLEELKITVLCSHHSW